MLSPAGLLFTFRVVGVKFYNFLVGKFVIAENIQHCFHALIETKESCILSDDVLLRRIACSDSQCSCRIRFVDSIGKILLRIQ